MANIVDVAMFRIQEWDKLTKRTKLYYWRNYNSFLPPVWRGMPPRKWKPRIRYKLTYQPNWYRREDNGWTLEWVYC